MKKSIYILFLGAAAWYMLTSTTIIDPDNPPVGRTGAPSEQTCASSDCHDSPNAALTGTIDITGVPVDVEPGKTYQITVKNTSTVGKATGFELTCLDANNAKCGTFTAATGVSIGTQSGRDYPRNSKKTQYVSGAASWTFPWTAPLALGNNKITFYYSAVVGNGDGKEHKDNVVSGNKSVNLKKTATIDAVLDAAVTIFPNPIKETMNIRLNGLNEAEAYLFDTNGRQVKKMYLFSDNQINVSELAKGNYLLQIKANDKQTIKKIVIQ